MHVVLVNRYLNCTTPELGGVICMIYVSGEYIVPGQWNAGGGVGVVGLVVAVVLVVAGRT